MLATFIKPLPLIFTLATTLGVMVHDTQIDRATTVALVAPMAFIGYAAVDTAIKSSDPHVHVERASVGHHLASLRSTLPRLQPREDGRNTQAKKLFYNNSDNSIIWPSV